MAGAFQGDAFQTDAFQIAADAVVSLTPADGAVLNVDPEVARWTPIGGQFQIASPSVPFVFAVIGSFAWTVYDGNDFTPFFKEHSTAVNASGLWTFSILPNGGWWRSNIKISYVSGAFLAE